MGLLYIYTKSVKFSKSVCARMDVSKLLLCIFSLVGSYFLAKSFVIVWMLYKLNVTICLWQVVNAISISKRTALLLWFENEITTKTTVYIIFERVIYMIGMKPPTGSPAFILYGTGPEYVWSLRTSISSYQIWLGGHCP